MKTLNTDMLNSPISYSEKLLTDINCPICNYHRGKRLYSVTAKDAAQHFILKEVDPKKNDQLAQHISNLWLQDTCDLVNCEVCGFTFSNPYIAGDLIFYSLAYERTGYPKWKWEYQITIDRLSIINSKPNQTKLKLLEIGAGDGAFVSRIPAEFVTKENIVCLEFSDYGRENIKNYGIKCLSESIHSLDTSIFPERFDIICLFQVLEHMDRLNDLFKQLNLLTNNNAHLFISVPNSDLIAFNELNGMLLDMPPNHIGRWNSEGFNRIGKEFGWSVKEHLNEPLSIKNIIKQQINYRYLKVSQDPSSIANKIERIRCNKIRFPLRILITGIYSLTRLNIIYKAIANKNHGDSQWVHLVKNSN